MLNVFAWAVWIVLGLVTITAAALPLGVEAQLAVAAGALVLMAVIKLLGVRGPFRAVYLGLGTFVILRYVFWRYSSTIPPIANVADFVPGIILVGAETYCVAMLFLSLFTVADPIERPPAPRVTPETAPRVDVFVPSYNESTEILATTLAAAKAMTYPAGRATVFLLDDGATDEKIASDDAVEAARAAGRRKTLQALCVELGVHYLAREDNRHAKAGNLNNGLANSDADLVVVFDADHAPAPEFLVETVGHFEDEKLFLVQTPHFFLNPDPIERNLGVQRMPGENEMFYGIVQKGLDKWNAAFFCGSAAVLRRAALEQVGGFHGSSITEDAETALELHSRGWKSLYVDRPMVAGLQPETFDSFIGQRSRWCRGMVQILLLKNPLFKQGLTFPQRLCYLSSSLFWLFPLSRMIFIFAPMFYIFLNMKVYIANEQEFLAYTVTYMAAALMIQSYIFGAVRWPWTSDVYEYIQSVQLFRAVVSVFIDPRRPTFNVTDKGQTLADNRLSGLATPYFAIFGMVAASLAMLGYRYMHEPNARGLLTVVGIWSLLNLVLSGLALGAVSERRERRSAPRIATQRRAMLAIGLDEVAVVIEDMSFGGARIRTVGPGTLPARTTGLLKVEAAGPSSMALAVPVATAGRRVFESGRGIGLRFYGTNPDRFRLIAETVFAHVGRIHAARRARAQTFGIATGTVLMIAWWAMQTGRGLSYVLFRRGGASAGRVRASSEQTAV